VISKGCWFASDSTPQIRGFDQTASGRLSGPSRRSPSCPESGPQNPPSGGRRRKRFLSPSQKYEPGSTAGGWVVGGRVWGARGRLGRWAASKACVRGSRVAVRAAVLAGRLAGRGGERCSVVGGRALSGARGGSGERGDRADRGQRCVKVGLAGPAGRQVKRPPRGVARQAPGDLKQAPAAGAGGLHGLVGQPDQGCW